MMDRQDLTAIKEIVTSAIQETVPDMIQEGIKATVPDMIQEGIKATVPDMIREGIKATVPDMIQEGIKATVPDMIREGIKATVPDIIDEKLQAGTEILLDVIEERAKETESVILGRLHIIEKYYHLHRLETSIQDDHKRMICKLQDEMKEVRARLGMA